MNEILDLLVEQAIERIKRAYEQTDGKIFLSFSGGKDSTVLAELIKMAGLPVEIPFVFADTRIELDATLDFVKEYDYPELVWVKPHIPFGKIVKDYGVPIVSKEKSDHLRTYHKNIDNPLALGRCQRLVGQHEYTGAKLADKYFHLLHPDLEYKITNKCCTYLKKKPFDDYAISNDMKGTFVGIRTCEGGVRAKQYKSCTVFRKKGKRTELLSMPIIDWTDEVIEEFIKKYNVKLSRAYTEYGFDRTGCVGCPYGKYELKDTLKIIKEKEPLKYKACMSWFGTVYMDMGLELTFDEDYMEKYKQRKPVNDKRREEMLKKYGRV